MDRLRFAVLLPFVMIAGGALAKPAFDASLDAQPEQSPSLVVLCDPSAGRLKLLPVADAASVDRGYPERRRVTLDKLFREPYPSSRSVSARCGPFGLRIRAIVLNPDPQGRLGGWPPFAEVQITRRGRPLLAATKLVRCHTEAEDDDDLWLEGACPPSSVSSLAVHIAPGGTEVTLSVNKPYGDREWESRTCHLLLAGGAHAIWSQYDRKNRVACPAVARGGR